MLSKVAAAAVVSVLFCSNAMAQSEICASFLTNSVFTKEIYEKTLIGSDDFKSLLCSASWRSASEAQSAGIEAEIPIYDLKIPFTANWDNREVDQWKSSNCSSEQRGSSYAGKLYSAIYKVNPASADAALQCVKTIYDSRAVRCGVTEGEGTAIFQVEWRRTNSENSEAAPKIISLTTSSATCLNSSDLAKDVVVSEGGVSLLCKRADEAPLFTVNTTRGQCFSYGVSRLDVVNLSGDLILDRPTTIKAARIKMDDSVRIITEGYNLQIIADDTLEISGSPRIVSFLPGPRETSAPGKTAGTVSIKARKVKGAGLSILNVGQDGGPGAEGPKGTQGRQGGPGVGRDPVTGGGGGFFGKVVEIIPKSCTGGKNGEDGGRGNPGIRGSDGAPGGAAGPVILSLPPGSEEDGSVLALVDTGLDSSFRDCGKLICGGVAGAPGPGGAGGDGGPGGPGASGTTWCGGTNAGNTGPAGEKGPFGGQGPSGAVAKVQYN